MDTAKHKGLIGKGIIDGQKVILVKPLTYMNLSGECIREVMDYYKADIDDLIVIFDDISLEPGRLRLRAKGSAGGHNGIKNIIAQLGSDKFKQYKIWCRRQAEGMGSCRLGLSRYPKEVEADVENGIKKACDAVACIMKKA